MPATAEELDARRTADSKSALNAAQPRLYRVVMPFLAVDALSDLTKLKILSPFIEAEVALWMKLEKMSVLSLLLHSAVLRLLLDSSASFKNFACAAYGGRVPFGYLRPEIAISTALRSLPVSPVAWPKSPPTSLSGCIIPRENSAAYEIFELLRVPRADNERPAFVGRNGRVRPGAYSTCANEKAIDAIGLFECDPTVAATLTFVIRPRVRTGSALVASATATATATPRPSAASISSASASSSSSSSSASTSAAHLAADSNSRKPAFVLWASQSKTCTKPDAKTDLTFPIAVNVAENVQPIAQALADELECLIVPVVELFSPWPREQKKQAENWVLVHSDAHTKLISPIVRAQLEPLGVPSPAQTAPASASATPSGGVYAHMPSPAAGLAQNISVLGKHERTDSETSASKRARSAV